MTFQKCSRGKREQEKETKITRERLHVGPELLDEHLDHVVRAGRAVDADTLGGHFLARVLEVEAHHAVEFELLYKCGWKINSLCFS